MDILRNKKGEADVVGVVTKTIERPESFESKFIRAVGVVALTLAVLTWLGSQLGISAASLQEGINAHNAAMWLMIGVIIVFGSVIIRSAYDIVLGRKTTGVFKTLKLEAVVVVLAIIMFAIINAGWLAGIGLTIYTP